MRLLLTYCITLAKEDTALTNCDAQAIARLCGALGHAIEAWHHTATTTSAWLRRRQLDNSNEPRGKAWQRERQVRGQRPAECFGTRAARHQNESRRTNAQFVSAQETISIHVQALERCFLRRRKTAARVTAAVRARAAGGKT